MKAATLPRRKATRSRTDLAFQPSGYLDFAPRLSPRADQQRALL
jgi:hypothetical protein